MDSESHRPAIEAVALVPAPQSTVFGYLADLENHWQLADRFIEVLSLERAGGSRGTGPATGGRVRMRGPLGLRRTALTRVVAADPPHRLEGSARVGARTTAWVRWELAGRGPATLVRLSAEVTEAAILERLLLRLGARAWLERRLAATLACLAERFAVDARDESAKRRSDVG